MLGTRTIEIRPRDHHSRSTHPAPACGSSTTQPWATFLAAPERRRQAPSGWRAGEGSGLRPSPCACPPPLRPAGWWQKSIAALTLLLLNSPSLFPAPGSGSVCGAGRSIRSQLPPTQPGLRSGLALWLNLPAFVSILSLSWWGPNLMFCSAQALSLNLSDLPFFCPSSGTTLSQPARSWDMLSSGPEDVICH